MPEISRFFGISIRMYFDDHNPPHFHAIYGKREAQIGIDQVNVLEGNLPGRAVGLVKEWADRHKAELHENWRLLHHGESPNRIDPLE